MVKKQVGTTQGHTYPSVKIYTKLLETLSCRNEPLGFRLPMAPLFPVFPFSRHIYHAHAPWANVAANGRAYLDQPPPGDLVALLL